MIPKIEHEIIYTNRETTHVLARYFRVTRQGALILYLWPWVIAAAFAPGTWGGGVVRGVGPEGGE